MHFQDFLALFEGHEASSCLLSSLFSLFGLSGRGLHLLSCWAVRERERERNQKLVQDRCYNITMADNPFHEVQVRKRERTMPDVSYEPDGRGIHSWFLQFIQTSLSQTFLVALGLQNLLMLCQVPTITIITVFRDINNIYCWKRGKIIAPVLKLSWMRVIEKFVSISNWIFYAYRLIGFVLSYLCLRIGLGGFSSGSGMWISRPDKQTCWRLLFFLAGDDLFNRILFIGSLIWSWI